jgi:hypothetical protein
MGAELPGCVKVWQAYNKNPRIIITVAATKLAKQYGTHYTAFTKAICYACAVDYIRHVEPPSVFAHNVIESPYLELMKAATDMAYNKVAMATKTETGREWHPGPSTMRGLAERLKQRVHQAPSVGEEWLMTASTAQNYIWAIMLDYSSSSNLLITALSNLACECMQIAAYPVERMLIKDGVVQLPDARYTAALEKEMLWQRRHLIKGITSLFERTEWPWVRA